MNAEKVKVVCIKHPKYNPFSGQPPVVGCKFCCRQYVDMVLARQSTRPGIYESMTEFLVNAEENPKGKT
jgi:hypothetical protein